MLRAWFLEYFRSLKRPDVEEWADLFLFRPLAFLLVKAIYRTSLTPNQLSVFSMVLGVAAGILLGTGGPAAAVVVVVLLFLSVVVDCADGQLARLKKNGTHMGRVVDGAIDYVVGAAMYLGLGFGFASALDNPVRGWLLVAAAAASNIIHSVVFDYYRNRYLAYVHGVSSAQTDDRNAFRREYVELGRRGGQELRRKFIRLYLAYIAFQMKISRDPMTLGPVEPEIFRKTNRLAMRLWTFLGSSTQAVLLMIALLGGRLLLYYWAMIVVLNGMMFALFLGQSAVDLKVRSLAAEASK
ncbi:MAG: CDP-alcohol phosphatidyltransferase family protein [Acidobacteriota bacterium]|nr:CDP-alcohol phosphatidyltransferase family protein [Acidobacteriota bacterium]HNT31060.1 CDP-alcohol phosphatidyltransferase family protein [Candidatus Aminicenantes bacterium]MDD8011037.1 CDP-alcohol phosphatidyltransferase family protein [Acidobacteriota bacterium]MDD8029447.1 CDP-alcohol phosphatidyltransferase family protein [Acidobacteriota bacterium]MDD8033528.1 CDP-alcohol phosphatidyltransferase family protein [Acidobacteriota bacterium]